jgi:Ca2+:H+ antiporter
VGGIRYPVQRFNRTAANLGTTLLVLSAIALVVPAIFHAVASGNLGAVERELSLEIACVLIVTYVLSLVFTLKTHAHLYAGDPEAGKCHHQSPGWGKGRSMAVLLAATAGVAVMSEFLIGAAEPAAKRFGMSEVFLGVIFVAVIGNAAEHSTAVLMAVKNKMDLAIHVAVGSSIQVALFVAPVLVFLSYFLGPAPMDLHFTTFEVMAVVLSTGIMALVAQDGESNWMEGVQLLAVYVILAIAFYFLPA